MNSTTITYFDFFDIEEEICKKLNLEPHEFRYYRRTDKDKQASPLNVSDTIDFWKVWVTDFQDNFMNDSIVSFCFDKEDLEYRIKEYRTHLQTELIPFAKAVYEVIQENQIKYIGYSW